MSRKHTRAVLVALLLLGVLAVTAAAAADGPLPAAYDDGNDCLNDANWTSVAPNDRYEIDGAIDRVGDVDYINLQNQFAADVKISAQPPAGLPFTVVLSLYDADANLLQESRCVGSGPCIQLPFTEGYDNVFLKVSSAEPIGGQGYVYRLTISGGELTDFNEPDNSAASATPIAYGTNRWQPASYGRLSGCNDQDYYTFEARAGDVVQVNVSGVSVQVLDDQGNILGAVRDYGRLWLKLPADGAYFLRYFGACDREYYLYLSYVEHEPNDSMTTATPIAYDVSAPGRLKPCDEVDTYTFSGATGDEITIGATGADLYLELLTAGGQRIAQGRSLHVILPADGAYFVRVTDNGGCGGDYWLAVHRIDQPVYLSFDKPGQVGGITFTPGDVLRYWRDSGRWEMALDLSAAGLNGNLTALLIGPAWGHMNFSLATAYQAEGVGKVLPQDIVALEPLEDGDSPRGCLRTLFDGSDVGLTTSGERIDSAGGSSEWSDNGPFLNVSTAGRASLPYGPPALRAEDEDLVLFRDARYGPDTSGAWQPFFDGSRYGLGAADVIGADADRIDFPNGLYVNYLWLVFDRPVTFGGIRFDPGDVAQCADDRFDHRELCLTVSKFFDASDAGLVGVKVDALEVGRRQ